MIVYLAVFFRDCTRRCHGFFDVFLSKNTILKKLILVLSSSALSCHASGSEKRPDGGNVAGNDKGPYLQLDVAVESRYIDFFIVNQSKKTAQVAYPFAFSFGRSDGGLELVFNRKDSEQELVYRLCAMIDTVPERTPVIQDLLPGSIMGHRFTLEDIRKAHCLGYGTYDMSARYHNVVAANDLGNDPVPVVATVTFSKPAR